MYNKNLYVLYLPFSNQIQKGGMDTKLNRNLT